MTLAYSEFLARKQVIAEKPGREVSATDVHPMLHPWQNELVRWAVRTSRARYYRYHRYHGDGKDDYERCGCPGLETDDDEDDDA